MVVAHGNTAEFHCSVTPDRAEVTWYIDGIPIYQSDKYKLREAGADRTLLIHHSNKIDEGTVTVATQRDLCAAELHAEGVLLCMNFLAHDSLVLMFFNSAS